MENINVKDFFRNSNEKLQVRDIFAMYNHEWDIIGEIIQNSIDSVMKKMEIDDDYIPEICIEYNIDQQLISVRDNGLGISKDDIKKVAVPHFTGKDPDDTNRGEFGVGLAFVAFSSLYFKIESVYNNNFCSMQIENGYNWAMDRNNTENLEISFYEEKKGIEDNYTKVIINPIRFPSFSRDKLIYVLQRYTAIGDFWAAFNDNDGKIKVQLIYIQGNESQDVIIKNRLWIPSDYFSMLDRETVNYTEVIQIDQSPRNSAIPNMIGKGMVYKGRYEYEGKEYSYIGLLCSADIYRELTNTIKINEDTDIVEYIDEDDNEKTMYIDPEIDIYPGIFACKKGMPLGADIPRPQRAGTGYWSGFYIVIHSDNIKTEPGRKKLNIKDERIVQSIAKKIFSQMEKLSSYVISKINSDTVQEGIIRSLDENRRKMREWKITNPLSIYNISTLALVEPVNEQTLIGLFHEIIGIGLLKGYHLIKLSTNDTYDGLYDYIINKNDIGSRAFEDWLKSLPNASEQRRYRNLGEIHDELIVIEFKLKLESIITDFLNKSKYHPNIKLLIVWEFDENKIKSKGWNLQRIPKSEIRYFGARYILRPSSEGQSKGILATHVLILKDFLDSLQENTQDK